MHVLMKLINIIIKKTFKTCFYEVKGVLYNVFHGSHGRHTFYGQVLTRL